MSAAAIDPGRLNRRLVLEEPVETPDGAGGVARGYDQATILWAEVTPLGARGNVEVAALGAAVTHRITLRAGRDITTRHRLRDGSYVYRIVSVRDPDGSGRFLEIAAEERID